MSQSGQGSLNNLLGDLNPYEEGDVLAPLVDGLRTATNLPLVVLILKDLMAKIEQNGGYVDSELGIQFGLNASLAGLLGGKVNLSGSTDEFQLAAAVDLLGVQFGINFKYNDLTGTSFEAPIEPQFEASIGLGSLSISFETDKETGDIISGKVTIALGRSLGKVESGSTASELDGQAAGFIAFEFVTYRAYLQKKFIPQITNDWPSIATDFGLKLNDLDSFLENLTSRNSSGDRATDIAVAAALTELERSPGTPSGSIRLSASRLGVPGTFADRIPEFGSNSEVVFSSTAGWSINDGVLSVTSSHNRFRTSAFNAELAKLIPQENIDRVIEGNPSFKEETTRFFSTDGSSEAFQIVGPNGHPIERSMFYLLDDKPGDAAGAPAADTFAVIIGQTDSSGGTKLTGLYYNLAEGERPISHNEWLNSLRTKLKDPTSTLITTSDGAFEFVSLVTTENTQTFSSESLLDEAGEIIEARAGGVSSEVFSNDGRRAELPPPTEGAPIIVTGTRPRRSRTLAFDLDRADEAGLSDRVEITEEDADGNFTTTIREGEDVRRLHDAKRAQVENDGVIDRSEFGLVVATNVVFEDDKLLLERTIRRADGDDIIKSELFDPSGVATAQFTEIVRNDSRAVGQGGVSLADENEILLQDSTGRVERGENGLAIKVGEKRLSGTGGVVREYFDGPLEGITRIKLDAENAPLGFIQFDQAGSILGNLLGNAIAGDDRVTRALVSGTLKTIGRTLGGLLNAEIAESPAEDVKALIGSFDEELLRNLQLKGVGAVSSYLVAQLSEEIGLDGFAGEVVNTYAREVLRSTLANLLGIQNNNTNGNALNAVGSLIGSRLAAEVLTFDTIGGQLGSSVGSAVGSFAVPALLLGTSAAGTTTLAGLKLGALAGPIGAAVGAFAGFILGGLIGSVFGGVPRSGADTSWSESEQRFVVNNVYSRKGGSEEVAESMASAVANTFNLILDATGGTLSNPSAITTGNYGMRKSDFVYRPISTRDKQAITFGVSAKDNDDAFAQVTNYGIWQGLTDPDFQITGGSNYVKRAIYATIESGQTTGENFDQNALIGNIASAQSYQSYLQNQAFIEAIASAEEESVFTG